MQKMVAWGWADRQQYLPNLFIKYRMQQADFEHHWAMQSGKCAGCWGEFAHPLVKEAKVGLKPEVDHNHVTGKVRGLLCRKCNDFLGKVKDNEALLRRLLDYLKRNGDWNG